MFAASKGRELSYEASTSRGLVLDAAQQELVVAKSDPAPPPKAGPSAGHGFFTGALLRSLEAPSTDANRNGVIELSELVAQVTVRVGRVSGGKQNPWVARRELFGDFGLARAR